MLCPGRLFLSYIQYTLWRFASIISPGTILSRPCAFARQQENPEGATGDFRRPFWLPSQHLTIRGHRRLVKQQPPPAFLSFSLIMDIETDLSATGSTASNGTIAVMMTPFFHVIGGDYLLFRAWKPTSRGAIAGSCVGLFLFSLFERWIGAISPVIVDHLKSRSLLKTILVFSGSN